MTHVKRSSTAPSTLFETALPLSTSSPSPSSSLLLGVGHGPASRTFLLMVAPTCKQRGRRGGGEEEEEGRRGGGEEGRRGGGRGGEEGEESSGRLFMIQFLVRIVYYLGS